MKGLYRPHRGSFEASMAESIEIESVEDIKRHLNVSKKKLTILYYCYDVRLESECYLVKVDGQPQGFVTGIDISIIL